MTTTIKKTFKGFDQLRELLEQSASKPKAGFTKDIRPDPTKN